MKDRWWLWIAVVAAVAGVSAAAGALIVSRNSSPNTPVASRRAASATTSTTTTTTLPPTTATEPPPPPTMPPPPTLPPSTLPPFAGVTLDQFNQIANGMPYQQVVRSSARPGRFSRSTWGKPKLTVSQASISAARSPTRPDIPARSRRPATTRFRSISGPTTEAGRPSSPS